MAHTFTGRFQSCTKARISIAPPHVEAERMRATYGSNACLDSIWITTDADKSSIKAGSVAK
jgi:hypothetical protein